jgi:hypothetical protein
VIPLLDEQAKVVRMYLALVELLHPFEQGYEARVKALMDEMSVSLAHVRAKRRLPLSLGEEVCLLREQVAQLQARGTEQLLAARAAAFEAAAKECESVVSIYLNNGHRGTEVVAETMHGAIIGVTAAERCAEKIRELAKR